jgi:hypothetical protein
MDQIVTPDSAVIGISTEKGIPMAATHEGLCKFASVDDDNYQILAQQIGDLAGMAVVKAREEESRNLQLAQRQEERRNFHFAEREEEERSIQLAERFIVRPARSM